MSLLLLGCCLEAWCQHEPYPQVLQADSTWTREVFPFPIHFAPELKYEGYEEAWFPPGWIQPENDAFWSYVFAWKIEKDIVLNDSILEENLKHYFDGLMNVRNKRIDFEIPKTTVHLKNANIGYRGKISLYDAFATQQVLELNVSIELVKKTSAQGTIMIFRFSPKPSHHYVWGKLRELTVKS